MARSLLVSLLFLPLIAAPACGSEVLDVAVNGKPDTGTSSRTSADSGVGPDATHSIGSSGSGGSLPGNDAGTDTGRTSPGNDAGADSRTGHDDAGTCLDLSQYAQSCTTTADCQIAVQYFCDGACRCNTAALNASGMASFSTDLTAVSSQTDAEVCACPIFPVPECVLGKCVACPVGESCSPNISGDGGADADAAATCAQAAAAVCDAPAGCADGGAGEMSLLSCEVGMVWVSAAACIAELTANCGAGAIATPMNPSIADPGACMRDLPFVCAHGQADIPADCVACVVGNVDAG